MNKKKNSSSDRIDLEKLLSEFKKSEESPVHRKDAFKIEGSFEDAIRKIVKTKPQHKSNQTS